MQMQKNLKRIRRALTLVEIMVVIMLITMITGVVAYNYSKSLDTGREFKNKEIKSRVQTILSMAVADGQVAVADVSSKWQDIVKNSPLVKSGMDFTKDANKRELVVSASQSTNGEVVITVD